MMGKGRNGAVCDARDGDRRTTADTNIKKGQRKCPFYNMRIACLVEQGVGFYFFYFHVAVITNLIV